MKPWEVLGRTRTPDGTELTLTRHPSEYVILANGQSLMSSRMHGSEDALAVLGCRAAQTMTRPSVLVGGLGMGFTLRAALDVLPPAARVVVAELVADVVAWNRGPLGALAGHPLEDPRVHVEEGDVADILRSNPGRFDVVLLDVDNGPVALVPANARLYTREKMAMARSALTRGGVLAIWSVKDDRRFERQLREAGFTVEREHVRGRAKKGGSRHTILLAHNRGTAPATP